MLLDQSRSAVGFAAQANIDPARLNAANAVLHLLDNLPTEEPAPDLLARTLSRVGAEPATLLPPGLEIGLGGQQTHA